MTATVTFDYDPAQPRRALFRSRPRSPWRAHMGCAEAGGGVSAPIAGSLSSLRALSQAAGCATPAGWRHCRMPSAHASSVATCFRAASFPIPHQPAHRRFRTLIAASVGTALVFVAAQLPPAGGRAILMLIAPCQRALPDRGPGRVLAFSATALVLFVWRMGLTSWGTLPRHCPRPHQRRRTSRFMQRHPPARPSSLAVLGVPCPAQHRLDSDRFHDHHLSRDDSAKAACRSWGWA